MYCMCIFSSPVYYFFQLLKSAASIRGQRLIEGGVYSAARYNALIEKAWLSDRGLVVPAITTEFSFLSAAEL